MTHVTGTQSFLWLKSCLLAHISGQVGSARIVLIPYPVMSEAEGEANWMQKQTFYVL